MINNIDAIHYLKINFDIAVCHKEFSLADKLADKLSILSLNELMSHSEKIEGYEHMLKDQKRIVAKIFPELQLESEETRKLEEKIKEVRRDYNIINQNWINVQKRRKTYSDEKINPNESEIDQLRKIVIKSARVKDFYSVKIGLERLSLLYQDKFILYSAGLDDNPNNEETRKKLFSLMNEWRAMVQLHDDFKG